MVRKSFRIIFHAVVLVILLSQPGLSIAEELQLRDLLAHLDRVASLYRDNALRFSCEEKITYSSPRQFRKTHRFEYIYEKNLAGMLSDYRTEYIQRPKKGENDRRIDPETYGIPYYVHRAYSWVFIFERGKRGMYDYEILGEGEALGRDAMRVGFEPVLPIRKEINDWFGTAWIDKETMQILEVKALK